MLPLAQFDFEFVHVDVELPFDQVAQHSFVLVALLPDAIEFGATGVAFCAKPVVRVRADVAIDRVDLSGVLALAGLRG